MFDKKNTVLRASSVHTFTLIVLSYIMGNFVVGMNKFTGSREEDEVYGFFV